MKTRHDGDCWVWAVGICTCGFFHDVLPHTDERGRLSERDKDALVRHDRLLLMVQDLLREAGARGEDLVPEPSPEEHGAALDLLHHAFKKEAP